VTRRQDPNVPTPTPTPHPPAREDLVAPREPRGRRGARYALAFLLGAAAAGHVARPEFFEAMVPGWMPGDPSLWNLASGAAEGVAALLLLRRSTSRLGGLLALLTLLAVFPANIDAALRDGTPGLSGFAGTREAAWLRLPFQLPPLWAAWSVWRRP
jgi:uncharacterized membrane protein